MKIRPNIFLTSDSHFGHQKMVEWGHRKETHNEDMVEAWNLVVGKDDVVLHLGDLTMCNKEQTQKWTLRLNGEKYLILGNHDDNSDKWYQDCGFTVIPDAHYDRHDRSGNLEHFLLTHEPIVPLPIGWYNIHGHLHGDKHRNIATSNYHFDVGVDAIGFKPKPLFEIMALFTNIKV